MSAVRDVIMWELADTEADICYIHDLFQTEYSVSGSNLARLLPERKYCDEFHNRILFDETIPRNITIYFSDRDSLLNMGRNLSVDRLDIHCGNRGSFVIGDDTSVVQATCMVFDAKLRIRKGLYAFVWNSDQNP